MAVPHNFNQCDESTWEDIGKYLACVFQTDDKPVTDWLRAKTQCFKEGLFNSLKVIVGPYAACGVPPTGGRLCDSRSYGPTLGSIVIWLAAADKQPWKGWFQKVSFEGIGLADQVTDNSRDIETIRTAASRLRQELLRTNSNQPNGLFVELGGHKETPDRSIIASVDLKPTSLEIWYAATFEGSKVWHNEDGKKTGSLYTAFQGVKQIDGLRWSVDPVLCGRRYGLKLQITQ